MKGPFIERVPASMDAAAKLPRLQYASPIEALSEQFHAAPALLKRLNPRARFLPGSITVPAVKPFNDGAKPQHDAGALSVSVTVSRDESALRVTAADGTLVFFAPVSSGSTHDPLPVGAWKVTGVTWYPVFHYNPDLSGTRIRRTTPSPSSRDRTILWEWSGSASTSNTTACTGRPSRRNRRGGLAWLRAPDNWDAARVAALVQPGTPVVFE